VFARQAATAIEASKVQRDTGRLLREVLRQVGEGDLSEEQVEGLAEIATDALDRDEEAPFWRLVDLVSRMRDMSDRELTLVTEILEVVARSSGRPRRRG
jgi:hypothetical protein